MKFNRTSVATVFTVALLVMAVMTSGALAALTYDNETTDNAGTSDLLAGDTVTDLDNSSKQKTLQIQSNNATSEDNFVLRAVVNDSSSAQNGETIYETTAPWTIVNSTSGYYNKTITHSTVFENLERDANDNITVDLVTVYNETKSDEESASIHIHAQNDANPTLVADKRAEIKALDPGFFSLETLSRLNPLSSSDSSTPEAARFKKTVNVTDNTSTMTVAENDQNVSTALDDATEGVQAGALTVDAYVLMDDQAIPVFYQSADVEWLDTGTATYAVADTDSVTVHNVNSSLDSGVNSTDVVVVANGNLGVRETYSMLNQYDDAPAVRGAIAAGWGSTFEEPSLES